MKKILIIGCKGQVGASLMKLANSYNFEAIGFDHPHIDITNLDILNEQCSHLEIDLLINAAAYTAVDKAEEDEKAAYAVNDLGTKNLGLFCKAKNIPCFHISTDYVFDGTQGNYKEADPTNPVSIYGQSKLAGEASLKETWAQNVILRSCWIYSEYGNNFLKTMIRLAQTKDELGIVADQYGGPTSATDVAKALLDLTEKHFESVDVFGLYHFSGTPYCNWYEFAMTIFEEAFNVGLIEKIPTVNKLTTEQYPTPARRPANSCLDIVKIKSIIPEIDNDWKDEVKRIIKVLKEEQS
ncbi:MAG: dTDP-4-dehydrorhamnose reductase [Lentisphaerales bacterium]|nr:dTDP-4-dehydrorhamnose reductase [Lentisphaerales bacterium]